MKEVTKTKREKRKERTWRRKKQSIDGNEVKGVRYKGRKEGKAWQVLSCYLTLCYNVGLRLKKCPSIFKQIDEKVKWWRWAGCCVCKSSSIIDSERGGTNKSHFHFFTSLVLACFIAQGHRATLCYRMTWLRFRESHFRPKLMPWI